MADLPDGVPDWVKNPEDKILEIVIDWLVSGFFEMSVAVVSYIDAVFGAVWGSFGSAGAALMESLSGAGQSIILAQRSLRQVFTDMGAEAGLAAPVATLVIFIFVMGSTVAVLRTILAGVKWV